MQTLLYHTHIILNPLSSTIDNPGLTTIYKKASGSLWLGEYGTLNIKYLEDLYSYLSKLE